MKRKIKEIGVMIDCSRDAIYPVPVLKDYFEIISKMGFNSVQLYMEDVFEVEGEPFFGYMRGRYSKEELKEIDRIATSLGIELIPCVQTLAHLGGITRWQAYADIVDTGDILLADEEGTYALVEKIFATLSECFTSRRINIGMDEAQMIGLGQYLHKHGYQNRFDILLKHLERVSKIAEKYSLKPMIWSDMFFRMANQGEYYATDNKFSQEVIDKVPKNIELVYWDYYSTDKNHYDKMLTAHKQFNNRIIFAGGAWCWHGFAPNNRYSIKMTEAALSSCLECGIDEILITCWKDDGAECSLYSNLPALMCSAEFAKGNFDMEKIKRKFKRIVGIDFEVFMNLDLANPDATDESIINPCKYMLYSDMFMGLFDLTAVGRSGEDFAKAKRQINLGARNKKFGYIFKTLARLCDVLEVKYTLGVRTRESYKKGDRQALLALAKEYGEVIKRLERFYEAFLYQWNQEAKPFGFEKQDLRIGGLIRRVKHCKNVLTDYANGKIDNIPQLEEDIVMPLKDMKEGVSGYYHYWETVALIKPDM